jgi:hypothetical protein
LNFLDEVLGIVAAAPCGDSLVLRGSMAMRAWVGDRARAPGDLDWVVRPIAGVPLDDLDPHPYVNRLRPVQTWAEATHGGARNEMWTFEEFDTGGARAYLPPEGTHWVTGEETTADASRPHLDLLDLLQREPRSPAGFVFDSAAADIAGIWGYGDYHFGQSAYAGGAGVRVTLPWRFADAAGAVQLDFAYDDALPEPAVLTAVPRHGGGPPHVVWTATRELSLAWKLQWLGTDQAADGHSAGKDLYDAVLLAELDGIRLPPRLIRLVLSRVPDRELMRPAAVRRWRVEGMPADVGPVDDHLDRLAAALERLLPDR